MNIVNNSEVALRADKLLADKNPSYSRAALAKLFETGNITYGDKAAKPGDKIKPGQSIDADISPITKPADDIELPILFEDDNVIVIDKPSGVISHARGRYWDEASVASFIRARVSNLEGERAGIVHRLDRATSGVMVCAKNSETLSYLQKQFNQRTVKKHYIAIVKGSLKPSKGLIDIPLMRSTKEPNKFVVNVNGKSAQTEFYTELESNGYSLVRLHPLTGRTHQLRLHLKHLNKPIVGDTLYSGEPSERLMLHATSLEITIPGGVRKVFKSELPKEFKELLNG